MPPPARRAGDIILRALERTPISSARTSPPCLSAALQSLRDRAPPSARTSTTLSGRSLVLITAAADISATLFLSLPSEYDGGELVIEDTYGSHAVKLAAGDIVIYPHAASTGASRDTWRPDRGLLLGPEHGAAMWSATLLYEMDTAIREFSAVKRHGGALCG